MVNQIVVTITNVKKGKNRNWLSFAATIGRLDQNRTFNFEFCGTEINHGLSIQDSAIEQLREMMSEDFGFAPYDIKRSKDVLGKSKSYTLQIINNR